jgi:hypothetical protein
LALGHDHALLAPHAIGLRSRSLAIPIRLLILFGSLRAFVVTNGSPPSIIGWPKDSARFSSFIHIAQAHKAITQAYNTIAQANNAIAQALNAITQAYKKFL